MTDAGFDVDVTSLESALPGLQAMKDFVDRALVPGLDDVRGRVADPRLVFGGFPAAGAVAATHEDVRATARARYGALSAELGTTITATRWIIENYRSAEERNRLSAQNVLARLAPPVAPAVAAAAESAGPPVSAGPAVPAAPVSGAAPAAAHPGAGYV
ncbi:MAG TPA: hypothetical protein VGP02_01725 [Mycobacteriales bacterium]|nr:hypothetical protein [Mycobacteriales bacterium]